MEFGFIAILIALAVDFKLKELRNRSITQEEYQRLSYKGSGKEVYLFLGSMAILFIMDQQLPEHEALLERIVYGLIVGFLLYSRTRFYIESKIKKLNPEYTRYALFSVLSMGLASAIFINEKFN